MTLPMENHEDLIARAWELLDDAEPLPQVETESIGQWQEHQLNRYMEFSS